MKSRLLLSVLSIVFLTLTSAAQQAAPASSSAAPNVVPSLINYSGILKDSSGRTLTSLTGVTFLLYSEEQGGAPLWMETQNVQPDNTGRYSVQLGAVSKNGLPSDLFMNGEARWLAVQIGTEPEQVRTLLVAVPYAMKSVDAQTLGGLPPSAFVLATPPASSPGPSTSTTPSASSSSVLPPSSAVTTNGGTGNTIAMFSTATDVENSILTQTNTTAINVNGQLSLPATGTATSTTSFNSQAQDFVASVFNSGTAAPVAQTFQWQAEPVNNDKTTATGQLSLLYAAGGATPAETGLKISSKGVFTFASGQKFAGTGTVTSVAAGAGLAGGTITKTGTLGIASAGVSNAMLQNSSLNVNPGTALTGGGSVSLGGSTTLNLDTSQVPLLAAANSFTGNQTVNGNLSATGMVTGTAFQIGSNLFDYGSYALGNAFLGFGGNTTMTGTGNTASGYGAFALNTGGLVNTANGYVALASNNTGSYNTAGGAGALYTNTTGNFNTASGGYALFSNTTASNNTANGATALFTNTTGHDNTAEGYVALYSNTTGIYNTADGSSALGKNSTGSQNTAAGWSALSANTTGFNNVAYGFDSGNALDNSSITGSNDTLLGAVAELSTGTLTNATAIGANALVSASNAMVLGSINGVNGATASTNVGIGTTTPAATLDVHGTGNFTGLIAFAAGQTFPGTGTITGVTPGTGLTGGGNSGSVTLNVDTTKIVTGVVAGSDLTGGGTGGVQTLNLDTTKVPLLVANNTFIGNQTVTGNLSASGVVTGSSFQIGSNLFAFGSYAQANAFFGFAGNTTTSGDHDTAIGENALSKNSTGFENTATGYGALLSNTTGSENTATGHEALYSNSTGFSNTAMGWTALVDNTTGALNTATGYGAGYTSDAFGISGSNDTFLGANTALSVGSLFNATAIGAYAEVAESNAMVLGGINGVNQCTAANNCASTFVGINTTAPTYLLHIGNQGGVSYNNFLRIEGPASGSGNALSIGGHGDFAIDAPGIVAGRFTVKDNGIVTIGVATPIITNPFQIRQGLGSAIADGWTTYSSRRWKTNIHVLPDALSKVERLRGVSYDLKDSGKHEIGVIAEEVGEVVPEVVSYEKNGRDAQSVDYSRLTALLIEAVKQQQKQIAALRAQLRTETLKGARLESRLTQLEKERDDRSRLASAKPRVANPGSAAHPSHHCRLEQAAEKVRR